MFFCLGLGGASVVFHHMSQAVTHHVSVQFQEQTMFTISEVTVDLSTGRTTLVAGCTDVAEYTTLGFCVGILYVLLHGRRPVPALSVKDVNKDFTEARFRSLNSKYVSRKHKLSFNAGNTLQATNRPMTLGKLKMNRRRKKSIICTMLLACGLQQSDYPSSQRGSLHSLSSLNLPDSLRLDQPNQVMNIATYSVNNHQENLEYYRSICIDDSPQDYHINNNIIQDSSNTDKHHLVISDVNPKDDKQNTNEHESESTTTFTNEVLSQHTQPDEALSDELEYKVNRFHIRNSIDKLPELNLEGGREDNVLVLGGVSQAHTDDLESKGDSAIGTENEDENDEDDNIIFIEHF